MIAELMDTPDQWRRQAGRIVGDNVCVLPSLVAKAAFVCAPATPFEIKPDAPKIGLGSRNRVFRAATRTSPSGVPARERVGY